MTGEISPSLQPTPAPLWLGLTVSLVLGIAFLFIITAAIGVLFYQFGSNGHLILQLNDLVKALPASAGVIAASSVISSALFNLSKSGDPLDQPTYYRIAVRFLLGTLIFISHLAFQAIYTWLQWHVIYLPSLVNLLTLYAVKVFQIVFAVLVFLIYGSAFLRLTRLWSVKIVSSIMHKQF